MSGNLVLKDKGTEFGFITAFGLLLFNFPKLGIHIIHIYFNAGITFQFARLPINQDS